MTRADLGRHFVALYEVVEKLASEGGCPWDSKQTVATLSDNFREECEELIEATSTATSDGVVEELGDLLYLVCLSAAAAERRGSFTMRRVLRAIHRKAVTRHPEQFGGGAAIEKEELAAGGGGSMVFLRRKQREQPRFCWSRSSFARPENPS